MGRQQAREGSMEYGWSFLKSWGEPGHQYLTPVILATWEAEIRSTEVRGQFGQIVREAQSAK
jgi:hypothetical protein